MTRLLTFRFDDGFMVGARRCAEILEPHRGSYFIVADRVLGVAQLNENPKLVGRDFGSVAEWQKLATEGHDVQAHSYSHRAFSTLSPEERESEIRASVSLVRSISAAPIVFAFPFNDRTDGIDWAALGVSAAGFDTRSSDFPLYTNICSGLDRFALRSWAVRERHWDYVTAELDEAPADSWTILGLHSLDEEGAEPWSSEGFARLVNFAAESRFDIVTARQALERI